MYNNKRIFARPEAIFWWRPAAWLRVTGSDALNFLQGQFTNDLRSTANGQPVYGLWLDHKGKVLADSFIGAAAEGFWVASYTSSSVVLRARLEAYIIADDVVVTDEMGDAKAVTLFGVAPADVIGRLPSGLAVFSGRRGDGRCTEIVMPAASETLVQELLAGVPRLSESQVEQRRIAAAIPAVPRDIGPTDLPQEGGLERDAVSFTKGCYLGQEVMARLNAMGQVRRSLVRVQSDIPSPALPAPLFQEGKKIGELRSAVATEPGFVGLALVTLLNLRRDAPLALVAPGGGEVRLMT